MRSNAPVREQRGSNGLDKQQLRFCQQHVKILCELAKIAASNADKQAPGDCYVAAQ